MVKPAEKIINVSINVLIKCCDYASKNIEKTLKKHAKKFGNVRKNT